ncbi:MAG: lactate racemase domain-containing protein [Coprococcus sp.]
MNEVIGIPFEHIVVLIGLGTHHKNTPADQKVLTGAYVYDHVAAVVDHDCDAPDLVDIGTTSYGTRVLINPLSIGRKVICIGGTVHHLMAGYGGGRKSIVPGIAGRETIRHNHAMALDPHCEQSDPRVGQQIQQ